MTTSVSHGKPYAGKLHVRFDEGADVPDEGRLALLYLEANNRTSGMDERISNINRMLDEMDALQRTMLDELSGGSLAFRVSKDQGLLPQTNVPDLDFSFPRFDFDELEKMPDFDETALADWRKGDLPMMFASGILGALSSLALKDYFAELHKAWGNVDTLKGGHHGELIDKVPERYDPERPNKAGGIGHRFLYGHDLFNVFDLFKPNPAGGGITAWQQYVELAAKSGTVLPPWMKAFWFWMRHLLQDMFSREGLLLPGHSLLRRWINPAKHARLLKYLGTIKARDVAGTGVTNLIMGGYLWGTEGDFDRVVKTPNYRCLSLMAGANLVNVVTGLCIPPPSTSLNWSAIPIIGYYAIRLLFLEQRLSRRQKERKEVLWRNSAMLTGQLAQIAGSEEAMFAQIKELARYTEAVERAHDLTISNSQKLVEQIMKGE